MASNKGYICSNIGSLTPPMRATEFDTPWELGLKDMQHKSLVQSYVIKERSSRDLEENRSLIMILILTSAKPKDYFFYFGL